jgi:hypothetical protein
MTPGVNLTTYPSDFTDSKTTILGKITISSAGSNTITGFNLQTNADNFLHVTGTSAGNITLQNCNLNCNNFTGILFDTVGGGTLIIINNCFGNVADNTHTMFTSSGLGTIAFLNSIVNNSGGSTVASTVSVGGLDVRYSTIQVPISISGTTAAMTAQYSTFGGIVNAVGVAITSTNGAGSSIFHCFVSGGTSAAITIAAGAILALIDSIISSAAASTNALTGGGVLNYGLNTFIGTATNQTVSFMNAFTVH